MQERIRTWTRALMMIPGLSGHEGNVRRYIKAELHAMGISTVTDRLGNLIATVPGSDTLPSIMFIAHMDQLGLIVRKIEANGMLRVERLGGVPEKALAAQEVVLSVGNGREVRGLIANKSHHATTPEEKYKVLPYMDIYIDCGFSSAAEALAAGINIGTPVVYAPNVLELSGTRIAGTSVDDRAACAVLMELAREMNEPGDRPTLHFVFSVQEEFNLRGAITAAQMLEPDICIQLDLALATDTPDMGYRGDVRLGDGPVMSMYSFHGRGTLNGCLPHPALVRLMEDASRRSRIGLQRSAHIGALTETSYVQLVGEGVACIDMGFPARYTHSALEVCDLGDLTALAQLLIEAIAGIDAKFSLDRDDYVE
jgi:putative aminopeptidase FrvX